ncbi:MAG TPA: VWA domain-containing protein [Pyrinomonadaceae bacterium]
MRQPLLAALLIFATCLSTFSQTPQPAPPPPVQTAPTVDQDDVVKINTNLVQIDAVVTKDGKPVKNLTAQDFEIFEDNKQQEISSFAFISNVAGPTAAPVVRDKNAPPAAPVNPNEPRRVVALVVDDLGLSAESISTVRKNLIKFIDQQVAPNDLVAIIRTGGVMGALQQFTNDRRLLDQALSQVKWNMCSRVGLTVFPTARPTMQGVPDEGMDTPCGGSSVNSVGNTLRALGFIVGSMAEIPGRKSLIIFSDSLPQQEQDITSFSEQNSSGDAPTLGADTRNFGAQLQRIAEKAIRSSVVIYAIEAGGLQYTGLTAADSLAGTPGPQMNARISGLMSQRSRLIQQRREGAERIAKQTGGFLVQNSNSFKLDQILEDQSGYYLIGYRPTDETFNRKFHHIKARVKKSGMTLRTRYGFFGMSEEDAAKSKRTPTDKATVALMSPFKTQEIPVDMNAYFTSDKTGSMIRVLVSLDPKDLSFNETADGAHESAIQLREIIFGSNGAIVDQQTFNRKITLPRSTYDQTLREGITMSIDLPLKRPGAYQVRVAALDVASSKVGSAGQFVQVPDLANHRLALSGIAIGAAQDGPSEKRTNPVIRRFPVGTTVRFACGIYNAALDPGSQLPNVSLQIQLYRDGKPVLTSPPMVVDTKNQPDLTHLIATGVLQLGNELTPGSYYLQLIATDASVKDKPARAVQWIDFEIVK